MFAAWAVLAVASAILQRCWTARGRKLAVTSRVCESVERRCCRWLGLPEGRSRSLARRERALASDARRLLDDGERSSDSDDEPTVSSLRAAAVLSVNEESSARPAGGHSRTARRRGSETRV